MSASVSAPHDASRTVRPARALRGAVARQRRELDDMEREY
eukprot:gene7212-43387_t